MKKIIIICSVLIAINLSGVEFHNLSWNNPKISSQFQSTILEKNLAESRLIPLKKSGDHFAILALSDSFRSFFSKTDQTTFLHHTLDKKTSKRKANSWFDISFYGGTDFRYNHYSKKNYYYYNYAVKLTGNVKNHLFYYANWYMGKFGLDMDYAETSVLVDTWHQRNNSNDGFYIDNMTAKIQYNSTVGDFAIGRGKYEIGSNIGGSIILNDEVNDYGYFSHNLELGNFKLSFMHATLIADSTNAQIGNDSLPYRNFEDKYISVHKLDWRNERVHIYAGEHVVYGSRSIDPNYLLPHTFMRVTEHNLNNRDNVLIFTGGDLNLTKSNSLYLNIIFDELSKSKLFTSWWANKYAIQMGNSQKLGLRESRITAEITVVRPWMYTHNILVDKFSHEDRGLGFSSGSNLVQYTMELNLDLMNSFRIDLQSSYTRQGSVGNMFYINYDSRPSENASWLEGEITDTYRVGAIGTIKLNYHNRLKLGYEVETIRGDDPEGEISFSYQAMY